MATPDSIGTATCGNLACGKEVVVRKNSGGYAYYNCAHCTFAARLSNHTQSAIFIKAHVRLGNEPLPGLGKKPEKAAISPSEKPAAPAAPESGKKPEIPAPPAKKQSALSSYLYGDSK